MRLDGLAAIVTGAGRGIGRAIALAYAREGARLALAARSANELEDTAQEIQALGAQALVIPTDVTDRGQVDQMVAQVMDRYSTVDVLVNNAGIAGPMGALHDNDPDRWVRTIQVNLIGTYFCSRAVLPTMVKQDRGRVINISSSGAMAAHPLFSAYLASKTGIVRLTEGLALELAGTNVRVNSLSPGGIHTRMLEEERDAADAAGFTEVRDLLRKVIDSGGEPVELTVELAVFLASADAGSLSGKLLTSRDAAAKISGRIPEIMGSDAYLLRRVELP